MLGPVSRKCLVGLAAWPAFAALTVLVVLGHGAPLAPDRGLHAWSLAHRPPVAAAVARGLTDTGTGVVPYALAVVAGVIAARTRRQRGTAVPLALGCLVLGQVARYGVMALVGRARPPHADWQALASGWSYPSGHTTTSAMTAGLLIAALYLRAPRGRGPLMALAACWAVAVGLTRVFLGVHWFTDVVGGWLFATGWLCACGAVAARWLPGRPGPGAPEPGPADPSGEAEGPLERDTAEDPPRRGGARPA
ncbi:phosphatase PAP2 family protein [Streptomyces sp. NEAU-sy36]|uniref:phosphatase PAP2 family protein n=1 Tax=unclassified Streptomyces TaxID=2593676 RepID=UPI0015D64382|nr:MULTISPECIES: phosphatase PAP2 family protein [unclassified Streptomyces]QLJ03264.1 phosphatase PAP2 family protein [Streptomyces sp. NEAU-sy36]